MVSLKKKKAYKVVPAKEGAPPRPRLLYKIPSQVAGAKYAVETDPMPCLTHTH